MQNYKLFTSKADANRAFNQLRGIIEGISLDGKVNDRETTEVDNWLEKNQQFGKREPFKELISHLQDVVADGVIDDEEVADMRWVCDQLVEHEYFTFYDRNTADLEKLQGLCHGIVADGKVNEQEVRGIAEWIGDHAHLCTYYPYDEMVSVLTDVLSDGKIDEAERKYLLAFFHDFVELSTSELTEEIHHLTADVQLAGICAMDPDITVAGKRFVLTGESGRKMPRKEIELLIEKYGGTTSKAVSGLTDYLVVGDESNPCWAYACYGRKIEKAIGYRKQGKQITILHENDFWDWVEENPL